MKRDALDAVFSDLIRTAALFQCQRCGIQDNNGLASGKSVKMHCSHIYSRKHNSTRWFPDNALCLCAKCHSKMESRPLDHAALAEYILGPDKYSELMKRHHQAYKYTKNDKEEMKKFYRKQLREIQTKIAAGIFDLNIESWD